MPDDTLTAYAARVEAAIAAYLEVREFADAKVWRAMFEEEKRVFADAFHLVQEKNGDLDLHPILAVLFVVLNEEGDLADVNRTHPRRNTFKYFNPFAVFPGSISHLLPSGNRWWKYLAAQERDAHQGTTPSCSATTSAGPAPSLQVHSPSSADSLPPAPSRASPGPLREPLFLPGSDDKKDLPPSHPQPSLAPQSSGVMLRITRERLLGLNFKGKARASSDVDPKDDGSGEGKEEGGGENEEDDDNEEEGDGDGEEEQDQLDEDDMVVDVPGRPHVLRNARKLSQRAAAMQEAAAGVTNPGLRTKSR